MANNNTNLAIRNGATYGKNVYVLLAGHTSVVSRNYVYYGSNNYVYIPVGLTISKAISRLHEKGYYLRNFAYYGDQKLYLYIFVK